MDDLGMQQDDSPSAAKTPPSLPAEVMQRILELACGPRIVLRNSTAGKSDVCTATLLQLALTSRALRAFATPRLYAAVRLNRPSALQQFQRTVCARPVLGQLVKSLHIGADTPLAGDWWPIYFGEEGEGGRNMILRLNLDMGSNGPGTRPYYDLSLERKAQDDFGRTMRAAFADACEDLTVDLGKAGSDGLDGDIGEDAWHVRAMEVQAALELYHQELRASLAAGHSWTPNLVVKAAPAAVEGYLCLVTRAQIYERMSRPGAPTDSFQHPLLFARSGLSWRAKGRDNLMHSTYNRGLHRGQDHADVFGWPGSSVDDNPDETDSSVSACIVHPADLSDPLDPALPGTVTVAGNIALARCVLGLTPHVASLSLTGVLEGAVVGERHGPELPLLRSLTLGPPPAGLPLRPRYDHATLGTIERLRICGGILTQDDSTEIFDEYGAFQNLRSVQWSMVEEYNFDEPDMIDLVSAFIGLWAHEQVDDTALEAAEEADHDGQGVRREETSNEETTGEEGAQPEAGQQSHATQDETISVEARLHPMDVELVMTTAPTPRVAKAWHDGRAVPGIERRFKLRAHGDYVSNERLATQELYDEGKRFWEEG